MNTTIKSVTSFSTNGDIIIKLHDFLWESLPKIPEKRSEHDVLSHATSQVACPVSLASHCSK